MMNESVHLGYRKSQLLLALLGIIDLFFIGLHILRYYSTSGIIKSWRFSLANDWAFPEMFQYCQELAVIGLLVVLFIRYRSLVYPAWITLFTYVLLDDMLEFHEQAGRWIGENVSIPSVSSVRISDIGELIILGSVGLIFIALLAIGYYISENTHRRVSIRIVGLFALFTFFGGFFDILHEVFHSGTLRLLVGIAEDGGEMLAMSLTVWYLFRLVFPPITGAPEPIESTLPLSYAADLEAS